MDDGNTNILFFEDIAFKTVSLPADSIKSCVKLAA